ncbi:hypothetical protein ACN28S_30915 [Cystobacter fuscus]
MTNLLFSGNYRAVEPGWRPDLRLVRRIFGIEPFAEGCGIGVLAAEGEYAENTKRLSFDMTVDGTGQQVGAILHFRGLLRVACSWDVPLERAILKPEYGGKFGQIIPHLRTMAFEHNLELRFDWSGEFNAASNLVSKEVLSMFNKVKAKTR